MWFYGRREATKRGISALLPIIGHELISRPTRLGAERPFGLMTRP